MFHKTNLRLFGRELSILFRFAKERSVYHYGIGNRCKDGHYVLFLDYDDTPLEWIKEEVKLLQNDNRLGTAYVFATKHGHHVIFLEKLLLSEVIEFLNMTSVDKNFRDVPMTYGRKVWVLRQSGKKEEKILHIAEYRPKTYKGRTTRRSYAHFLWLQERYNATGSPGGIFDKEKTIITAWYRIAEQND